MFCSLQKCIFFSFLKNVFLRGAGRGRTILPVKTKSSCMKWRSQGICRCFSCPIDGIWRLYRSMKKIVWGICVAAGLHLGPAGPHVALAYKFSYLIMRPLEKKGYFQHGGELLGYHNWKCLIMSFNRLDFLRPKGFTSWSSFVCRMIQTDKKTFMNYKLHRNFAMLWHSHRHLVDVIP